jgi:hypothetical protein
MVRERERQRHAAIAEVGAKFGAPIGLRLQVRIAAGDERIGRRRGRDEITEVELADVAIITEAQLVVACERARDLYRGLPERQFRRLV